MQLGDRKLKKKTEKTNVTINVFCTLTNSEHGK